MGEAGAGEIAVRGNMEQWNRGPKGIGGAMGRGNGDRGIKGVIWISEKGKTVSPFLYIEVST